MLKLVLLLAWSLKLQAAPALGAQQQQQQRQSVAGRLRHHSDVVQAAAPASKEAVHISRIAVIGERHSGTNFMRRLLQVNLDTLGLEVTNHFCANKHKYQVEGAGCPPLSETVVVVMFRNPYDWALAMHRECWCEDEGQVAQRPGSELEGGFDAFLRQPWLDNSVKAWGGERRRSACANIMRCRALKILNFLNLTKWARNVEFVRHEDVITIDRSLSWLKRFSSRYHLKPAEGKLRPIKYYKGEYSDWFDAESAMSESVWFNQELLASNATLRRDMGLVTQLMDAAVESMVGYSAAWLDRPAVPAEQQGDRE